jgi:methylenetetrahydrofolate reductase (NADPH)
MNEMCEVYPERKCVWVRIHKRVDKGRSLPKLLRPADPRLFFTSSYLNLFTGRDKLARTPITYLELGRNRKLQPRLTASALEQKLRNGKFVFTSEIRAPRGPDLTPVRTQAAILKGHFDAVNATAYLNGRPSMPSAMAAAELVKLGVEPIMQSVARDVTQTAFVSELVTAQLAGINNILCITGDYYKGDPCVRQVFDIDSALMLYEARHLRQTGVIHFTGQAMKLPPKPFLGCAINPFTRPANVPIRRLKQKVAAGADFVQTQLIMDIDAFGKFMQAFCEEGLDREVFLIAGVPVIISAKALEMLTSVPGVSVPPKVLERFRSTGDIVREGIAYARELICGLHDIPGVNGAHLMLFGIDHAVLPQVVEGLR